MEKTKWYVKYQDTLIAISCVTIVCILSALCFDFYFDLNDDVYIKSVTSGTYNGTPASHNIQMLYPLSLILSILYRILPDVVWYSLLLAGCNYGALYLIMKPLLVRTRKTVSKVVLAVGSTLLFTGFLFYDLIFVQYTVTAAILTATATFRFYLEPEAERTVDFIKKNIGNILLLLLAFCIRSEMLLLLLPMVAVAGFCKWMTVEEVDGERSLFARDKWQKYPGIFAIIVAGLGMIYLCNAIAYASPSWSAFMEFFDGRTNLYDYQVIPPYEGNEAFYQSISMDKTEVDLLISYNFSLDEKLDGKMLEQIAQYAKECKNAGADFRARLRQAFIDYKYHALHETDMPWNIAVLIFYFLVLFMMQVTHKYSYVWKLCLLGAVRSALWMYICLGNRAPGRITHSLYFMELSILAVFLFQLCRKTGIFMKTMIVSVCTLLGVVLLYQNGQTATGEYATKEMAQERWDTLEEYCKNNRDGFYFVDLYSGVGYSEKLFSGWKNESVNYELLGGWIVKSPLMYDKFHNFGIKDSLSGMTEGEKVFVIANPDKTLSDIVNYIHGQGISGTFAKEDSIVLNGQEVFTVYRWMTE